MSNNNTKEGIDVRLALEILSQRPAESSHSHHQENKAGCHHNAPAEAKSWGQRIDIEDSGKSGHVSESANTDAENIAKQTEEAKKRLEEERKKRRIEIETRLQSMSVKDLLQCFLESQKQRVATYRKYDSGLDEVLNTRNVTNYPAICAEATATFSVLSDTINLVQKNLLETHHRKDLSQSIIRLQQHEREKLNLTAALHLERIREQNNATMTATTLEKEGDNRVKDLLQKGVTSLRGKIASCVDEINEILEEIRYALLDEGE